MALPITLPFWLLSILPIVLLLILMIPLKWGVLKAAPTTLLITIMVSLIFFRTDLTIVSNELLKGLWNSVNIVLVIFTAILLYQVSAEGQAFVTLNNLFKKIAPNELIRILLIGVVFASFLQGVTGFGVPILVTAPLLMKVGVKPLWSVVIPLLGHSWAGTFGTLALAWEALILQTGMEDPQLVIETAFYASVFLSILTLIYMLVIVYFYGKWTAIKKSFIAMTVVAITLGSGQITFALIKPELAAFIPSALSLLFLILLANSRLYNREWKLENSLIMNHQSKSMTAAEKETMTTHQALLPYYLVTVIALVVLLIPFINQPLSQIDFGPAFSETVTGYDVVNPAVENYSPIAPFTNASAFLLLASLLTYYYYRKKSLIPKPVLIQLLKQSGKKALSPSVAVICLLAISRVMAGSGLTIVMAEGIAGMLGEFYVGLAPFIGLLGTFITGSNMSSNILFGDFQFLTADFVGLNRAAVVGAQTTGGGIGTAIAPGNITLGTSTVGILGKEGKVLSIILPIAIAVAVVFGLFMLVDHFFIAQFFSL